MIFRRKRSAHNTKNVCVDLIKIRIRPNKFLLIMQFFMW
jgi:hypothetical protein